MGKLSGLSIELDPACLALVLRMIDYVREAMRNESPHNEIKIAGFQDTEIIFYPRSLRIK